MTLITLRDLENSLKINQILNGANNTLAMNDYSNHNNSYSHSQNNINFMLQNSAVTKTNLLTNAMLQQIQNKQLNKMSSQGSAESFSQNSDVQKSHINSGRYKTELCRQFIENGGCKYGDKCQFAHGMSDLKDVNRHPKYKTDYCKTFHSKGFCPYGPRCHFIHELSEKIQISPGSAKKIKPPETARVVENTKFERQLENFQARVSSNILIGNEELNAEKHSNCRSQSHYMECEKQNNVHYDDLNSSFLSASSPPLSPKPHLRTRSGTSSTSSLISSTSSYELSSQSDRVFSPAKPANPSMMRHQFNIPISKNLIQIGRNLIQEKLSNADQDQAALNQQILNIERLNNLLNNNLFNFYQVSDHPNPSF